MPMFGWYFSGVPPKRGFEKSQLHRVALFNWRYIVTIQTPNKIYQHIWSKPVHIYIYIYIYIYIHVYIYIHTYIYIMLFFLFFLGCYCHQQTNNNSGADLGFRILLLLVSFTLRRTWDILERPGGRSKDIPPDPWDIHKSSKLNQTGRQDAW